MVCVGVGVVRVIRVSVPLVGKDGANLIDGVLVGFWLLDDGVGESEGDGEGEGEVNVDGVAIGVGDGVAIGVGVRAPGWQGVLVG